MYEKSAPVCGQAGGRQLPTKVTTMLAEIFMLRLETRRRQAMTQQDSNYGKSWQDFGRGQSKSGNEGKPRHEQRGSHSPSHRPLE